MLYDCVPKAHNPIAKSSALGIRRSKRQKPKTGNAAKDLFSQIREDCWIAFFQGTLNPNVLNHTISLQQILYGVVGAECDLFKSRP